MNSLKQELKQLQVAKREHAKAVKKNVRYVTCYDGSHGDDCVIVMVIVMMVDSGNSDGDSDYIDGCGDSDGDDNIDNSNFDGDGDSDGDSNNSDGDGDSDDDIDNSDGDGDSDNSDGDCDNDICAIDPAR